MPWIFQRMQKRDFNPCYLDKKNIINLVNYWRNYYDFRDYSAFGKKSRGARASTEWICKYNWCK